MKTVIDVNVAGIVFPIEEDAYCMLKNYLERFELTITDKRESHEVMEDVEARVAEILQKKKKFPNQVIDLSLVRIVIEHLGEINDESAETFFTGYQQAGAKGERFLFRNPDAKKIAGVCAGLAAYFDMDTTLMRIIFLCAAVFSGMGILLYIILWIATPQAQTIVDKLKMRGLATTPENIKNFSTVHTKQPNNR
jgi:phage shock protein PspC (stress-responsive transcriptional regulator)